MGPVIYAAALWDLLARRTAHVARRHHFKDCTLTFNAGFHAKTIDNQVSLNRVLTFWH